MLKALMSGMQAGFTASAVARGVASEDVAAAGYRRWCRAWFESDVSHMRDFYAELREPAEEILRSADTR